MSRAAESWREAAALDAAAAAAEADAGALEAAALDRGEDIGLADVEEHQERARGLRWRAKQLARRAEREAVAERVARLGELRERVEEYAGGAGNAGLEDCLHAIRAAAARFGELVAQHNETVARFAAEAAALGVAGLPPSGIAGESDGSVGLGGGGQVVAGDVILVPYPEMRPGEVVPLPGPVRVRSAAARPAHIYFSRAGAFMALDRPGPAQRQQVRDGGLVELTAEQADRYMAGREVFGPGELERTRADQAAAVAAEAAAESQAAIAAKQAAELALAGQWSPPAQQKPRRTVGSNP